MANWKHTLDVAELWKQADDEAITASAFCNELINKLHAFVGRVNEVDVIIDQLKNLVLDDVLNDNVTFDDVDEVLEDMYDWADKHRVWVKKV